MAKSVKANYLFNLINSASQLLFPLITFPYASRIMMADGIGQVNFFQSIISYISLFTCLGIPMYAMREVAKVRDNGKKMTQIAVEIPFTSCLFVLIRICGSCYCLHDSTPGADKCSFILDIKCDYFLYSDRL